MGSLVLVIAVMYYLTAGAADQMAHFTAVAAASTKTYSLGGCHLDCCFRSKCSQDRTLDSGRTYLFLRRSYSAGEPERARYQHFRRAARNGRSRERASQVQEILLSSTSAIEGRNTSRRNASRLAVEDLTSHMREIIMSPEARVRLLILCDVDLSRNAVERDVTRRQQTFRAKPVT